ncbi:histidine--tRNA ligase [Patescibacteria group bacterium]|nr:histidine--tRNA ligase [Patescibacteria group bacterium]
MTKFQTPTGMHDLFEEDLKYFQKIEKVCQEMADFYGFQRIETPILEDTRLFEKGTGVTTDIVQKQMFSFRTRGGDQLTLRPEGTPGIVRAYIQQGMQSLPKPVKLWHFGPFFRYERPQAGRFRQFYQFGFESLGVGAAVIDAQIIQIFYNILKTLGLRNLIIEMNSIGDSQCRPYFKKTLVSYLRSHRTSLCSDCKRRLRENPLRVLDCKQEKCQRVARASPQTLDHLCKECHDHFKNVLEFLEELELPYSLNPCLVRGLDYYTKTVFEIFEDSEEGRAQGALPAGGRYDDLVKMLGGKETPACGGSCGVERVVNLMRSKTKRVSKIPEAKIFLAQVGQLPKRKALKLLEEFRKAKIKMVAAFDKDSLSSQLKLADKLNMNYTLILGQKEALEGKIIIREMASGKQKIVSLKKIVREMKKKIRTSRFAREP